MWLEMIGELAPVQRHTVASWRSRTLSPRLPQHFAQSGSDRRSWSACPRSMIPLPVKQHNTVIDGTFNIWQGSSGLIGVTGSDAASAAYGKLCKRLYEAGITLVAGTDNSAGTTYNRELELYEEDGIPAARVLQIATLVPPQVMQEDKNYGSIAPGKVADVVIINGHPAEHVSELRKIDLVFPGGADVRPERVVGGVRVPAAIG